MINSLELIPSFQETQGVDEHLITHTHTHTHTLWAAVCEDQTQRSSKRQMINFIQQLHYIEEEERVRTNRNRKNKNKSQGKGETIN